MVNTLQLISAFFCNAGSKINVEHKIQDTESLLKIYKQSNSHTIVSCMSKHIFFRKRQYTAVVKFGFLL